MTPEETLIDLHKKMLTYWISREPIHINNLMGMCHSKMTGFGTGLEELYDNRDQLFQLIQQDHEEVSDIPIIDTQWLKAKVFGNTGTSWAQLNIKISDGEQYHEIMKNMRMSLTWNKEKEWKIVHSHFSAPWVVQQEGERFPMEELQSRNRELEEMVAQKTADLIKEKNKTESLLHNILPVNVAKELIEKGHTTPAKFEEVTVLFTDFVSFTKIVDSISIEKLIQELNALYSQFDDIMKSEGIEKIKTIGDAYLAVCGVPEKVDNHAIRCVTAAKKILTVLEKRNQQRDIQWQLRIGIHTGPIVAGVIGKNKFTYDIFGDTINVASRLEASSEPGKINITSETYHLIKEQFPCDYRGKISAKGKGAIDMYFVKN